MPETQAEFGRGSSTEQPGRDILSRIVETKSGEISRLLSRADELRSRAADASETRDFRSALAEPGVVSLIAEVKRRSPGAGPIRPNLDPAGLAEEYLVAGASALSVLTDREYFGGSLADLLAVRSAVSIPVLRKDFLLSNVQILEARSSGADAVLLIVGILGDSPLTELRLQAEELGMTALVEVHDANEMARALDSGASVIGINNRDLRGFTVSLETTIGLRDSVPDSVILVSESGIRTRSDVEVLARAGVDAVLVGEALLRAPVPGKMVSELSGVPSSTRSPASVRR